MKISFKLAMIFISVLLSLTYQNSISQQSWFSLFRKHDINGMDLLNSTTAIAAGQQGIIYKSTDAGSNWINIDTISNHAYLWAVDFVNENTGWAVGNYGTVVKTTNGGNTWNYQNVNHPADIYDVKFLNASTGWIAGSGGVVMKTTNGGNAWEFQNTGTFENFYNIEIVIPQTIWISGDSGLYKTTNGGSQWIRNLNENWVYSVEFVNEQTGYAGVRFGKIFKTTNGGSSWSFQTNSSGATFYSMKFANLQTGWAVGDYITIIRTSDGGASWQSQYAEVNNPDMKFSKVLTTNESGSNCIISGFGGWILKTTDSGLSWFPGSNGSVTQNYLWSLSFVNDLTGWAAGGNGTIIKTTTGGSTWFLQNSNTLFQIIDINFANTQTGWACGHDGLIIKTTNSGLNWNFQNSGVEVNLFNSFFLNSSTGWIAGDTGILKTQNGGQSWEWINLERWVYSVYFINANTGFAGVRFGKLMKTTDGGSTWSMQTHNSGATFYSIKFINENTGWAVGDYNTIVKTTDAGGSWMQQQSGLPGIFEKFSDVNTYGNSGDTVWISGFYGVLLKTINGGSNWYKAVPPEVQDYNSIQFTSYNIGYSVGSSGTIIKTTNGGLTFINQNINSPLSSYYLEQNYPNPFNPVTHIRFIIPKQSSVKLIVYNILGKEVKTMVNQILPAGTHDFEFDGKSDTDKLSSGVYFYTLRTDDFVQTKRMVLLK
ncbi:MAG: Ycf48-like protein [Ignavibacteria bacterium]|nr:Ycf48-like protein [Ignavibacteria bacterium]